ncbi:hypothetical protein [Tessaracoccus sp.]
MSLMQRTGAVLAALLLSLVLVPSSTALAETPQPPIPEGSNAVGACLDADQVWLLVVDIDGEVLANQCVGTPSSGEEALTAGGLELEKDKGFICAISGHPDPCPAAFDGSYWNYHHTTAGAPYTFSQEGAETRVPSPGDIEAWCYNMPEVESCEPPLLTVMSAGKQVLVPNAAPADYFDPAVTAAGTGSASPTVSESATAPNSETDSSSTSTPWALIGVGGVIIVGVVALLLWRRRPGHADEQVGRK